MPVYMWNSSDIISQGVCLLVGADISELSKNQWWEMVPLLLTSESPYGIRLEYTCSTHLHWERFYLLLPETASRSQHTRHRSNFLVWRATVWCTVLAEQGERTPVYSTSLQRLEFPRFIPHSTIFTYCKMGNKHWKFRSLPILHIYCCQTWVDQ